jgi:hypothetical protein
LKLIWHYWSIWVSIRAHCKSLLRVSNCLIKTLFSGSNVHRRNTKSST